MEPLISPWVGNDYEKLPCDQRVLLLGESMYTDKPPEDSPGEYDPNTLRRLIEETIAGRWKKRGNFYLKVYRLLSGKRWSDSPPIERRAFWHRVVFYNYVQWPVRGRPKDRPRPRPEMWTNSNRYFGPVLDKYAPAGVIVLGKETWQNLLHGANVKAISETLSSVMSMTIATQITHCQALVVNHPSYRGLTADQRRQDRDAVMRFVNKIWKL